MTLSRERRAYDLYQQAYDRAPSERAAFLDEACADSPELRAEVESLFRAHAEMGGFLGRPASESLAGPAARVPEIDPGAAIGAYRVIRRLGGGAGGSVYEAEQARPRRRVAVKVLRAGFASSSARRRFLDEAQVLARLDHPGIARIFEAGVHTVQDVDVPYFALELVEGARPLTVHANAERLGLRARVALLAELCDAVHHGHQQGVLHRDLKPANVLVDARGRVKVIDFGIAREVAGAAEPAGFAGTVAYMSPEQTEAGESRLDVRSDVYALGAILYEVLTGRLPHDVEGLPLAEAVRRIRSEPPAPPGPGLPRDLVAIASRATAARREDRYASAAALGDDLRRHLAHRAVEAVRGGGLYHAAKFARRQPLAFGAIALVLVVSVAAAVVAARLANEKEAERRGAEFQAYVANVAAASAALRLNDVAAARRHLDRAPVPLRAWEWYHLAGRLDTSETTWRWDGYMLLAGAADSKGERLVASGVARGAGVEMSQGLRAWDLRSGEALWTVDASAHRPDVVVFAPDDTWFVAGCHDGAIDVRDAATGALRATLPPHGREGAPLNERHVNAVVIDPGGRWMATGSGDRTIRVWDLPARTLARTLEGHADRVICMAHVGGPLVAAGIRDGSIVLWDVVSGEVERTFRAHERSVESVAVNPEGTRLVSVSRDETVRLWDLRTGEALSSSAVHEANVSRAAFSPSGRLFATSSWDRTVALFAASGGEPVARLRGHTDSVEEVFFLPGGALLASLARDGAVKTWRIDADHEVPTLRGHDDFVWAAAADPGARFLVTVSGPYERRGRVWDLRARRPLAEFSRDAAYLPWVEVWPDAGRFAAADLWGKLEVRSIPEARPLAGPEDAMGPFALDARRGLLYAATGTTTAVGVWRCDSWTREASWDVTDRIHGLAVSPDGTRVVVGAGDGTLTSWDASTHERLAARRVSSRAALRLAFDPAGGLLAVCDRSADVRLVDGRTLAPLGTLSGHASEVHAVTFSPDGTRVVTASHDATVRVWDVRTLEPVAVLDARRLPVHCLAFVDGGRTLVTVGGLGEVPGEVRLWSAPGLR